MLLVTLYTYEGNSIRTSALVYCEAISNYVSLALFHSWGTPITCSSSTLILAADGHVISSYIEETTVRCHFNLLDGDTEERFTVAPIRHLLIFGIPWLVQFNPQVD